MFYSKKITYFIIEITDVFILKQELYKKTFLLLLKNNKQSLLFKHSSQPIKQ